MKSENMSDLLNQLLTLSKCSYISDLHNKFYAENISEAVKQIDAQRYSLQVWKSTINYITSGQVCSADSVPEAIDYLLDWLHADQPDMK